MLQYKQSAGKIVPQIFGSSRRGVDSAVRVDGHHNVTPGRELISQVSVAFVVWDDDRRCRRTYSVKRIGGAGINPRVLTGSAGRMIAVQENEEGIRRGPQPCTALNPPPNP